MKTVIIALVTIFVTGCGNVAHELRRLQTERDTHARQIAELQQQQAVLEQAILANVVAIDALNVEQTAEIAALQVEINLALAQLASLQQNVQVTSIIDPCGDGPGFDEVILQTSSGYMAYFETGTKRFLALLPNGIYVTTDQQACQFSIVGGILQ